MNFCICKLSGRRLDSRVNCCICKFSVRLVECISVSVVGWTSRINFCICTCAWVATKYIEIPEKRGMFESNTIH